RKRLRSWRRARTPLPLALSRFRGGFPKNGTWRTSRRRGEGQSFWGGCWRARRPGRLGGANPWPAGGGGPAGARPGGGCGVAGVSRIAYEIEREDEARRLGIRVGALDDLVRGEGAGEDELQPGQGRPVRIEEIDLWPTPVDGAQVLDEMAKAQRRYMVMPEVQADAIT